MQKYKEAAIKELKKIRDKISNQVEERTGKQRKLFNAVTSHMIRLMEIGNGAWVVKNQEGEDTIFSYLDAIRILENVNDMGEFHQNLRIMLVEKDGNRKSAIYNAICECIFPYLLSIGDIFYLKAKKEEIQSLDYLTEPEEVSEEVKAACEKESERLLRVAEEKRRANR